MAKFSIKEILTATGGKLMQFPVEEKPESEDEYIVDGISTDTRTIREGNAFLALIGENFDGNSEFNYAFCKRDEFYWVYEY